MRPLGFAMVCLEADRSGAEVGSAGSGWALYLYNVGSQVAILAASFWQPASVLESL